MNAFESMVGQLHMLNPSSRTAFYNVTIPKEDYDIFCKEFVFEKLKGFTFGEAFCKKFNIQDYALQNVSSDVAKSLIETLGYIK